MCYIRLKKIDPCTSRIEKILPKICPKFLDLHYTRVYTVIDTFGAYFINKYFNYIKTIGIILSYLSSSINGKNRIFGMQLTILEGCGFNSHFNLY